MADFPTAEHARLAAPGRPWDKWGPYVSERQWGTVREDYSADGNAWAYFPHDQARSRAYRWGEDGLGGWSDDHGLLNMTVALWNGHDPILKERLFGLTNSEGNHGEDVKELYFYQDALPSHAYARMLYKYPVQAYPYEELVRRNRTGQDKPEYELLDTGVLGAFFDVQIEYAKQEPEVIVWRVTATLKADQPATLHVIPQFTARNRWSWAMGPSPRFSLVSPDTVVFDYDQADCYRARVLDEDGEWLFTGNDTNSERLFGVPNQADYVKDGFHEAVVHGNRGAVNPNHVGTKVGWHVEWMLQPGETRSVTLLFSREDLAGPVDPDEVIARRRAEADEFYAYGHRAGDPELAKIQRQAYAGLIWSKQYYRFDVRRWLKGDPGCSPPPARSRNKFWQHVAFNDVFLMPDKWEYPWFAAWDLAFHTVPYSLIDPHFAKLQIEILLREYSMHPNGQVPAYEWAFSDVNPPVQAWAAHRVFAIERRMGGSGDYAFLARVFHKLMLNFTWWVNRKDQGDMNLFEGGFLGLDNIGAFDRNMALPNGMVLQQADGTSWMAAFCLNMMGIALELTRHDPVYEDLAAKFMDHFFAIAYAANTNGLWHDEDGFYYDWIRRPDGTRFPVRARTIAGLVPLFAIAVLEAGDLERMPKLRQRFEWYKSHRPEMVEGLTSFEQGAMTERHSVRLVPPDRLRRMLAHLLDEQKFLSPYGIRSVSKEYENNPLHLNLDGMTYTLEYNPGESRTTAFGGNSNWRGPIWFPLNFLIVEALQKHHYVLGDMYMIDDPTGSHHNMHLWDVSKELSGRLISLFSVCDGKRRCHTDPVYSQDDWRDLVLFHEYFHAETGQGLGASHQTGWTALVAKLIDQAAVGGSGAPNV